MTGAGRRRKTYIPDNVPKHRIFLRRSNRHAKRPHRTGRRRAFVACRPLACRPLLHHVAADIRIGRNPRSDHGPATPMQEQPTMKMEKH
jgi:hypothetical protein